MLTDKKMVKKINEELKTGTGNFKVMGKTCDGARWPEGNHFYIIDDMIEQKTYHIPVDELQHPFNFAPAGKWWNGNQEQIKVNGKIYALHGWNGESYTDSWQVVNDFDAIGKYDIRPVYITLDEPELTDYQIIER
jgi:hypothetical protein